MSLIIIISILIFVNMIIKMLMVVCIFIEFIRFILIIRRISDKRSSFSIINILIMFLILFLCGCLYDIFFIFYQRIRMSSLRLCNIVITHLTLLIAHQVQFLILNITIYTHYNITTTKQKIKNQKLTISYITIEKSLLISV